jgi:GxxExxY protein
MRKARKGSDPVDENELSNRIIGAAIDVHRQLGPGLLESVYDECLAYELISRGIAFERQKPVAVIYKEVKLDCGFRIDLFIASYSRNKSH